MRGVWEKLNILYVNKSLRIFPVMENGKLPILKSWQTECSASFTQILYWIENAKNCNWGLPATPNNLFVIDLDVHDESKNGIENFAKLLSDIGLSCEEANTLIQVTPSGGKHLIYLSDNELKEVANTSQSFDKYPGIDVRTSGYIVVEPSVINGKEYKFTTDIEPQPMPEKLKEFILNNSEKKGKEKTPYVKPKEQVEIGNRDNSLFQYINHLYYKTDLDFDEILLLAEVFNESFEEPYPNRDVEYKVKKAFEKSRGNRIIINVGGEDE